MTGEQHRQPRVESFPGATLAVVHRKARQVELKDVIPPACGVVYDAVKQSGQAGVGRLVAVYSNRVGDVLDLAVGVEVNPPVLSQELTTLQLPAAEVLTLTHFGPYDRLKEAFEMLHAHAAARGLRLGWPCWETYGHWEPAWNDDPSLIRTEVTYRLEP